MDDSNKPSIERTALSAILDSAVDAIITIDPKGSIISANPATETLFGYEVPEILGQNIKILMPSPYHEEHDGYLQNYRETGVRKIIGVGREVIGRRKDGSTFPMHLAVSEFEVGGQKMFAGIVRDISDLSEKQAQLEAILGNAVDAIITIDQRGLIDSANPATEKLFGHPIPELIGKNIKMLMPTPYRDEHDGYLENHRKTGVRKIIGIGREVIGQRKDGTTFPMHLAVSEIKVGDRVLFTGIVRDISDLKKAEQELAVLNADLEARVKSRTAELHETQAELVRSEKFATLGKVSGGIAHEIRNPLNAVKTSAYYLLNAKNPSDEKIREHLERIDRQVSLIDNVVTALSDVAKLPDAQLVETDMAPVLKSVIDAIGLAPDIAVELKTGSESPKVLVDVNQIAIAFKNLIRNARDAMPDGGTLSVHFNVLKDSVQFHVEDNGTGISQENLEKILEPLFTTKARGMGLGLSITRAIVEKNQGSLSVESELGKGSRFTISLRKA